VSALRGTARVTATRAPSGSTAARQYDRGVYRTAPMWPGITWGNDARCSCSWAFRGGVMQVKARSGACVVHIAEPSVPVLLDQLIALLAEAFEDEWSLGCGRRGGYHRHLRDGSEVCPRCREAEREDGRKRRHARPRKPAAGAVAAREAA
jgi:hypothetical protein